MNFFVALGLLFALAAPAQAQSDYPSHPIKLIVPYGPGGTPDLHARLFAEQLGAVLKQTVIVENKVGASGIVGAQAVSAAPKDGYTVLWAASSLFGVNPFVYKNLPYSPEQFQPVSNVVQVCFAIVVRPSLGVTDLKGLTKYMAANPRKLNFANSGVGNQPHLIWERYLAATGTQSTMIVTSLAQSRLWLLWGASPTPMLRSSTAATFKTSRRARCRHWPPPAVPGSRSCPIRPR